MVCSICHVMHLRKHMHNTASSNCPTTCKPFCCLFSPYVLTSTQRVNASAFVTLPWPMRAELYLSLLVAMFLITMAVFAIYMASRLPPHKAVSVPQAAPTVFPVAQAGPNQPQPLSNSIVEALQQTDENLKKRIIKLATKVRLKHIYSAARPRPTYVPQMAILHTLAEALYCMVMSVDCLCTHAVMMSHVYFTLSVQLRQLWISKHAVLLRQAQCLHIVLIDH